MLPLDKFDAALLTKSATEGLQTPEDCPERDVSSQKSERLALTLDFARITHHAEPTSCQPHVLFSPLHYESGYAYPLVVWLHGGGGDERQVMRIMPMLSMRNYVAVAPQGLPYTLAEEESVVPALKTKLNRACSGSTADRRKLASILGENRARVCHDWPETEEGVSEAERRIFDGIRIAVKRSNIARDRIFLAGFGTGGTMALRLGLLYPESFAGVASLDGPFPMSKHVLHRWTETRHLSVFLGVSEQSDGFSPEAACHVLELFHTAGVQTTIREYPCGRELVPAMFQDLNRWMMGIVCDRQAAR